MHRPILVIDLEEALEDVDDEELVGRRVLEPEALAEERMALDVVDETALAALAPLARLLEPGDLTAGEDQAEIHEKAAVGVAVDRRFGEEAAVLVDRVEQLCSELAVDHPLADPRPKRVGHVGSAIADDLVEPGPGVRRGAARVLLDPVDDDALRHPQRPDIAIGAIGVEKDVEPAQVVEPRLEVERADRVVVPVHRLGDPDVNALDPEDAVLGRRYLLGRVVAVDPNRVRRRALGLHQLLNGAFRHLGSGALRRHADRKQRENERQREHRSHACRNTEWCL